MLEVEPELATVHIRVEAQAAEQQAAIDLLTQRARAVTDLVSRYADGIERSVGSGLHVYPALHSKKTEKVRHYEGSVLTTVIVHDFDVLSNLLVAASAIDLASVDGPHWGLRPTSPAYREARIAAAADALSRARDYAAAYGAEVVSLVEIADEGMSHDQPPPRPFRAGRVRAMALSADSGGEDAFDLAPGRQQVSRRIDARFLITPPDLANDVPAVHRD